MPESVVIEEFFVIDNSFRQPIALVMMAGERGLKGAKGDDASAQAGFVYLSLLETIPDGYLLCDGSTLLISNYPDLFAAIGSIFGGDGITNFSIPDIRGEFPRFTAFGSSIDPDRNSRINRGDGTGGDAVGTKQDHQLYSHNHQMVVRPTFGGGGALRGGGSPFGEIDRTGITGGNETRPTNRYFNGLIRYRNF